MKPCANCKKRKSFVRRTWKLYHYVYQVICGNCGHTGEEGTSAADAMTLWNDWN